MATSDGIFLLSGGIAFAGSFAKSDGFPPNGYAIIGGTTALAFLSSLTAGNPLARAVTALAWLTLLVSIYVYVPALTTKTKVKANG